MAIGSGELFGKGLNNNEISSVKNGNFISEPQTDFIFAIVGEELGFAGGCLVVGLLFLITLECLMDRPEGEGYCGDADRHRYGNGDRLSKFYEYWSCDRYCT